MKLSPKLLAMALAAGARHATDAMPRLFLAQWLWAHPTSMVQKATAMKLLDVPPPPDERWPSEMPTSEELGLRLAMDINELKASTNAVRRMICARRVAWHARLLSATIEKDLMKLVDAVENAGEAEPFYKKALAAPGADRKYVRLPGTRLPKLQPTLEKQA